MLVGNKQITIFKFLILKEKLRELIAASENLTKESEKKQIN
jgi:hypothetical protein